MAIEKVYLDPNAQTYTDDDIVGKVNSATAKVSADSTEDGTTNKVFTSTDETKLTGIAEGAEANPADLAALDATASAKLTGIETDATADQTGAEVRDAIVALADDDRGIVISRPQIGQKKIYAIQTHTDGKQEIEQNDTAES